jgi:hypothetical protein
MNSVNSLYYHARISAPAPTIDLAAATLIYITHLARSLARWLANVRNGGTNGLPGLQASSDDSRYVLYCLPFLSFILHRESFSQHTDRGGRQMRCRDHLISSHSTTLLPILSGYDYCYVYCYISLLLCSLLSLFFPFYRRPFRSRLLLLLLLLLLLILVTVIRGCYKSYSVVGQPVHCPQVQKYNMNVDL